MLIRSRSVHMGENWDRVRHKATSDELVASRMMIALQSAGRFQDGEPRRSRLLYFSLSCVVWQARPAEENAQLDKRAFTRREREREERKLRLASGRAKN